MHAYNYKIAGNKQNRLATINVDIVISLLLPIWMPVVSIQLVCLHSRVRRIVSPYLRASGT